MSPGLPISSSPRLVRTYAWGLDVSATRQGAGGVGGLLLVTQHQPSQTRTHAPCYNHSHNVIAYVDCATGQVTQRFEYDPFGNELSLDSVLMTRGAAALETGGIPFRFSTKYSDGETGLVYYGFRYYSLEMGRWLSRDPIEEKGGLNLYGMVGNDAVNRTDYLGLKCMILVEISHAGQFQYSPDMLPDQKCDRYMALGCFNTTDAINDDAVCSGRGCYGFPRVGDDLRGDVSGGNLGRVGPDTFSNLPGGGDRDGQNGIYPAGADGFGQYMGHAQSAAYMAARELAGCPCECESVTVKFFCNGPDITNTMNRTDYGHYCGMTYTFPASMLK